MNYKIEKALKDNRKYFIIFIIIWFVIELFLVAPLSIGIAAGSVTGKFNMNAFFDYTFKEISSFTSITRAFHWQVIKYFGKTTLFMTIIYLVAFIIGVSKSKPKNEFTDIEHGSSDWSENGEQYRVLSRNSGLILAEKNYLPVNKPGNVNVLIVGRIGCW